MSGDRYTSPETSRLLAEAGLEQGSCGDAYTMYWRLDPTPSLVRRFNSDARHRALDLTDVLHELVRPRPEEKDASPLVGDGASVNIDICPSLTKMNEFCELRMRRDDAPSAPLKVSERNNSPVEAAAAVLLALLRERKS